MIKNASLKDNQNLLKFIPKFLDDYKFEDVAYELNIGGEVLESVKMFDESVRLMQKQGKDANDYLRTIVNNNEGFADEDERYLPLKNFYSMIPAVSISYIDHITRGREKLQKRNNTEAFISDDGFAIGVVYLLRILGVQGEFNSLNWFDSVEAKLKKDRKVSEVKMAKKKVTEMASKSAYEEDENFAEELSIKRIENLSQEYQLLHFGITSASILFKEI